MRFLRQFRGGGPVRHSNSCSRGPLPPGWPAQQCCRIVFRRPQGMKPEKLRPPRRLKWRRAVLLPLVGLSRPARLQMDPSCVKDRDSDLLRPKIARFPYPRQVWRCFWAPIWGLWLMGQGPKDAQKGGHPKVPALTRAAWCSRYGLDVGFDLLVCLLVIAGDRDGPGFHGLRKLAHQVDMQ